MAFDFDSARQQGTDEQIVEYLKSTGDYGDFDFDGALQQGTATQVVDYLKTTTPGIAVATVTAEGPDMLEGRVEGQGTSMGTTDVSVGGPAAAEPSPMGDGTMVIDPLKDQPIKDFQVEGVGKERMGEQVEGIGRGVGRFPLGAARLGEDFANIFGAESERVEKWIEANEKYITDNNLEGEALVGEIASALVLPGSYLKAGTGAFKVGAVAGAETATTELGAGKSYGEAAVTGTVGAVIGTAAAGVVNKIVSKMSDTTPGTKLLVERIVSGMSPEEAAKKQDEIMEFIKTIPKEHQANVLANMSEGRMGLENVKEAAKKYADTTARLNNVLRDRKQVSIAASAGNSDVKAAQGQWDEMLANVEETSPQQFSTTPLKESLDYIENIYGVEGTGKVSKIVREIKADTAKETLTVSQAINVRKGINEALRKAKTGSNEAKHLEIIKDKMDNFIDLATTPETKAMIDETISNYSRVINNKQFVDVVEKNTKADIGVDWKGVVKDAKKAGLHSPEVEIGINIAKEFEKKFKLDKLLSSTATPEGAKATAGGALGVVGAILTPVKDFFAPVFFRDRHANLVIQNEIIKSIRSSDNITDVVTKLRSSDKIPEEIKIGWVDKLDDWLRMEGRSAAEAGGGTPPEMLHKAIPNNEFAAKEQMFDLKPEQIAFEEIYNDPKYFEEAKEGLKAKVVWMDPEDYMAVVREKQKGHTTSDRKLDSLKDAYEKNKKVPMPYLGFGERDFADNATKFSQEGFNRAFTATQIGKQRIPVSVRYRDNNPNIPSYIKKYLVDKAEEN